MMEPMKLKLNVTPSQKPPFVMFCLPGREFSRHFLKSYTELMGFCHESKLRFGVASQYSPVVYYVRNMCLGGDNMRGKDQKLFGGMDYTHIMWIDSDIVFNAAQFDRLLKHDKDIVSGLYLMQGGDEYATVVKEDKEYFLKDGRYQFLKPQDIEGQKDLFEVDYTGFGFILIKRGVFESVGYPWFRPIFHEIGPCYDFASEDASICQLFREQGYKIHIDPTIRVGHVKERIL